jgi:hypothetical protein
MFKNIFSKSKTIDEKLEILICPSNFCETCKEMIFQNFKKCEGCGCKKICYNCSNNYLLCKKCNNETEEFFNNLEKLVKKQEENHIIEWGDLDDLP